VEEAITSLVYAPLTQGQFDAIASLVFNISPGQFKDSEILRNLNAGEYIAAAAGFDAWRKARINGRLIVVDALVRRRAMEKAMFLEPPEGRPAAPTPLVTPEVDPIALTQAPRDSVVEVVAPLKSGPASATSRPSASTAANDDLSADAITQAIGNMVSRPASGADAGGSATPEEASKVVAARIARILKRAEQSAETRLAAESDATVHTRPIPAAPDVAETLADVDASRAVAARPRIFIDDTEVFDPGRDPAELFADGEAQQKAAGAFSSPVNAFDPRVIRVAPWIAILILSVLGLAIGLVDSFRAAGVDAASRAFGAAPTVLAVSGLMLIMSVYFIITRTADPER
jgi:hypothetical protein